MSPILFSVALALAAGPAPAQDSTLGQPRMPSATTLTLYAETGLEGPTLFIVEDVSNISGSFRTASLKTTGGAWEICDRANFRGRCRIADGWSLSLNRDLGLRQVQSVRPVPQD